MDRDQEKFYQQEEEQDQDIREEAAEQNPQTEENPQAEEVNDMTYFLDLLNILRDGLNAGMPVPLTGKRLVDADKLLMVVDDLEKNLPDAVQYGMQMYSQQDDILTRARDAAVDHISSAEMRANAALERARKDAEKTIRDAQEDADAILEDAHAEAERLLNESEILREARERASILKNDTRVEVSEMKLKARHDAMQLLTSVEDQLNEACKIIRRRRTELGDDNG